jgi:predicted GTPase
MVRKVIIIGAAGRDFHNFNVYFRGNPSYRVVAFTAAQIPYIENRTYPAELAGSQPYPDGVPIYPEERLADLIAEHGVDEVFFSYSDISYENLMHLASKAMAAGASFSLLGPRDTQLGSRKPVVAILATRTGAGKSTIARMAVRSARKAGLKPAVVRHPMPYGDLKASAVQHFAGYDDFAKYKITVEEEEEYSDHIAMGADVFAGVDYKLILEKAESMCDVVIWDGGNNDFSFYKANCTIVVADPLRAGHESAYHPSEVNVRMADAVVINKANAAAAGAVEGLAASCRALNPGARIFRVNSEVSVDRPELVRGKRVLVVEDGPSITHGELREGAGMFAARQLGCTPVDPRPAAVGSIKQAYEKYPWMGAVIPALGYSADQLQDLQDSIDNASRGGCDAVILGTPADLRRRIRIDMPAARVTFEGADAAAGSQLSFSAYLDGVFAGLK